MSDVTIRGRVREIPAEQKWYEAIVAEVKDLGVQPDQWNPGRTKHQALFVFQVDAENSYGDRMEVKEYINLTLGSPKKPSRLRDLIEDANWLGRKVNAQDLQTGISLKSLEGKTLRLKVEHRPKANGDLRAAIKMVEPSERPITVTNYTPLDERNYGGAQAPATPSREDAYAEAEAMEMEL